MKNTYLITYQFNFGVWRKTKVKAFNPATAARIVEARRIGNFVIDVKRIA